MGSENLFCKVCDCACSLLDVVDFNKNCEEARGKFLEQAGIPVYYALCPQCGFCFAPELSKWTLDEFEARIYNDEYVLIDPDCVETRPRANAASLVATFGSGSIAFRHLDYGGGNGLLARLLRESNWDSVSYDPFRNRSVSVAQLGKFDLITAYEVFEHVTDVHDMMSKLCSMLCPKGFILFSTLQSDGNIHANHRITWWYASPRNGHISLFSRTSLAVLAKRHGLNFATFSESLHMFYGTLPPWAAHVVATPHLPIMQ